MMEQITIAVSETLSIMGWLGLVLGLLTLVNVTCKAFYNVTQLKQKFSWNRIFHGFRKMLLFYLSSICVSVAFSILPYVNVMINEAFNIELISNEMLEQLSALGVLAICLNTIIAHGKKALQGITALGQLKNEEKESNSQRGE